MASSSWPVDGLEIVTQCPYCGHTKRHLAFSNVEDWAFGCAPGQWTYWDCDHCRALYLDPRPTPETINLAYASYYTHVAADSPNRTKFKQRLRNEIWFHALSADLSPRLHVPGVFSPIVSGLRHFVAEPFGLRQLAQFPRGLLVDVGCGNGDKLYQAARMGWRTWGVELDAIAANAAKGRGLDVRQGGYGELIHLPELADCILCSHVLEHVHEPLALVRLLRTSLKPNGTLLLSTPNSCSHLREAYGRYWRGLEAPRHLAIASSTWLLTHMQSLGFVCETVAPHDTECAIESERMRRHGDRVNPTDMQAAKQLLRGRDCVPFGQADAIQWVCRVEKQVLA